MLVFGKVVSKVLRMANVSPRNYISGFELLAPTTPAPSTGIFMPLAAFPSLDAQQCDPVNGDIREIMYEITRNVFNALNDPEVDSSTKPTKFTITRATPIGISGTSIRQDYTIRFELTINDTNVSFEPVAVVQ